MAEKCPERLDLDFLRWIWNYPNDEREDIMEDLEGVNDQKVIIFKKRKEVEDYLSEI